MKIVEIVFSNDEYNYITTASTYSENETIRNYFLNQLLTMGDGSQQKVIKVRFKYNVVSGSFVGQSGFLDPFQKWAFMPMLRIANGNQLGVAMSQLQQVV